MSYEAETRAALEAVRTASQVARAVQRRLLKSETLSKQDKSPVTVADFAVQAIVCRELAQHFPGDPLVGEESAELLRKPEQGALCDAVVREVSAAVQGQPGTETVLDWIDLGAPSGAFSRYWTLDPIDGTKGFMRGDQYAVALALIEDGRVKAGVLGCPNLPYEAGSVGALFTARRGAGAFVSSLAAPERERPARVDACSDPSAARFCESVDPGHSHQERAAAVAAALGITREPFRIDSQCKYACVAQGDASIYLRLPTRSDYREKIWDHAAGMIVVEEAGGRVSDTEGAPLDFRHGEQLQNNRGVVATSGPLHDRVLEVLAALRD